MKLLILKPEEIIATGKVFFDNLKNIKIDSAKATYSKKLVNFCWRNYKCRDWGKYIFALKM